MFALPPSKLDLDDLQQLSDAIDMLCDIVDGDREVFIEGLTEIVRRRAKFEEFKLQSGQRILYR